MSNSTTTQTLRLLQRENADLKEENERLQEEVLALREYLRGLQALQQDAQAITSAQELELFLGKVLYTAMKAMDAAEGSLLLVDYDTDELVFAVVKGTLQSKLRGYRISKTTGVAGWVATHAEPLIVDRPWLDDRFYSRVDETFGFKTTSLICAPLLGQEKVIGVIEVLNKFSQQAFNEIDLDLLTILAHIAAEAIERIESDG
jgi:sigma-B regulation protein RsbU (phosphoserine phosphatase)